MEGAMRATVPSPCLPPGGIFTSMSMGKGRPRAPVTHPQTHPSRLAYQGALDDDQYPNLTFLFLACHTATPGGSEQLWTSPRGRHKLRWGKTSGQQSREGGHPCLGKWGGGEGAGGDKE